MTGSAHTRPGRMLVSRVAAPGLVAVLLIGLAVAQVTPPERPTGHTESCVTASCHPSIVTRRVMHGPAAQLKCMACHVYEEPREHRFALAEPGPELCSACHVIPHRTFEHEPVRQGNCTACHDPHGSEHQMLLVADPARGLCLDCHQQGAEKEYVHGPVAGGACILCHDAHSSWQPKLLPRPARELCLDCHAELVPVAGDMQYGHQPFEEDCLACHDAHASDFEHQLHHDTPALCYGCHEETKATIEAAGFVHGAVTEAGGCLACHGAHSSPLPALQRDEQPTLCLNCHDRPLEAADGRALTDMAALLRKNPDHHGPIREGACSACHLPHAAEHAQLLRKAYPPEFYAPFDEERYALCFECHIPGLVRDEHGTGLTRFRDGDRNLHWLHVNRKKGRTCRACHEVHASRNPFHIRHSVPFGTRGWELEIRYEKNALGGSCTPGCHAAKSYAREAVEVGMEMDLEVADPAKVTPGGG